MNKIMMSLLLGAATLAPLYFATPAVAQSSRDIQRLEQQVQEAKNRGDWGAAQNLEVQHNVERLQYQRARGQGEVNDNGYQNNQYRYNVRQNPNYNVRQNPNYRYDNNRGYYQNNNRNNGWYDQQGRWHRN